MDGGLTELLAVKSKLPKIGVSHKVQLKQHKGTLAKTPLDFHLESFDFILNI